MRRAAEGGISGSMKASCAHAGETTGLRAGALAHALDDAEQRCAEAEERLTGPRRRVLELLLAADGPVKAYDLIAGFGATGEAAKPPTVYRALEFLERLGFAHRLESLNAYVTCRHPHHHDMAAFAICEECGSVKEFTDSQISERLAHWSESNAFSPKKVTVEVRGLCESCAK